MHLERCLLIGTCNSLFMKRSYRDCMIIMEKEALQVRKGNTPDEFLQYITITIFSNIFFTRRISRFTYGWIGNLSFQSIHAHILVVGWLSLFAWAVYYKVFRTKKTF